MKNRDPLLRRIEGAEMHIRSADRRVSPRYPVVQNRAFLAWWEEKVTSECSAKLFDISQGGALMLAENRPQPGQSVWVRLEEPSTTDWIEAILVGVVKVPGFLWFRKTSYMVRLRFTTPCPYDFFKSATHGNQLDAVERVTTLPEEDSRYWR